MAEKVQKIKESIDYQNVIGYMVEVLAVEFPTNELTPEYLILSILDNARCHANMVLDNILMSDTLEYLRIKYVEEIQSAPHKPILDNKNYKYSSELKRIISVGFQKAELAGSDYLGSEHLLSAILDPLEDFECSDKLTNLGVMYASVKNKCSDFEYKEIKKPLQVQAKPIDNSFINNTGKMDKKIPLKSEINSCAIVSNGNTPNITKYTIDLHEEISQGRYDSLVGREDILANIIKVLSRRKKNNVILVGKPGTGRTSLGYKLAEMIDSGNVPDILDGKRVIMLNTIALVSGTHLRGMFEERVDGLFKELKANPNYILFIDDMQNVVRNTGKDKDGDLTDLIGHILSEGDVRVVGTISFKDYRNGIENNSVLSTKLQKIIVEPSTVTETFDILQANKHYYESFHHVKFDDDCVLKAIKLAKRYITNNNLPDSAIDVLDLTGASISLNNKQGKTIKDLKNKLEAFNEEKIKAMNCGDFERVGEISKEESSIQKEMSDFKKAIDNDASSWLNVTEDDVSDTVSSMTGIPVSKLKSSDKTTILNIDQILKKDVIGQDEAIDEIAKAIKRSRAGFNDKSKVMASLMLISGTGCGKTLIAKKLAENIYGDENALVRFDMSEYQDKTSVNKLMGSSAGYVGYDNGGLLTEAIKNKPYCVLLFDEIEKADESIYNLFLQLFDEGRLTDNNGITVNFKNVIVIMTSNVGAKQASELGGGVGFQTNSEENKKSIIEKSLRQKFNPEFINRIDKIIHFNPLSDETLKIISKIELDRVVKRVKENDVILTYDENVVDFIYERALEEKEYGARPIMRIIQDNISDKVVDLVLSSKKKKNIYHVEVNDEGEIVASSSSR